MSADREQALRSSVSKRRPGVRTLAARAVVLGFTMLVAGALAEGMVRLARPGFPGFRVPQIEHRPVDGLGFEMIPNQVGYTAASTAVINSDGFRGPEVRAGRAAGDLRVLCLGDSITFGVGVEEDDPYPRQLEAMLARVWPERRPEAINAGVQRYFTYQEIDQLKQHGRRLRPDIVTLGVYPNDIAERPETISAREYENQREQAATSLRQRLPLAYTLIKNSAAVELAKGVYLSSTSRDNLLTRGYDGIATERDERKWSAMEREMEAFALLASEMGFTPVVIGIPARVQITDDVPKSLYPQRILEMARRQGMAAVTPVERFKESLRAGADPYLPWDNHLSRVGHTLIAEMLRDQIGRLERDGQERPTTGR